MATKTTMTIALEPEFIKEISRAAEADNRSRSNWVETACKEKIARDTAEIPSGAEEGETLTR